MKTVIQRVNQASVVVNDSTCGTIGKGLVILLGIAKEDTTADADYLLRKILDLRIFADDEGKMNRNISDAGGELLIISQFTLYGDCRRGRRPSFDRSAPPAQAQALYDYFVHHAKQGPVRVETGIFQAHMMVHLVNDGPVTILVDSFERTMPT